MRNIFYTLMVVFLLPLTTKAQNKIPMKESITNLIDSFASAIEVRDVKTLDQILHAQFRVIANQFNNEDVTMILSREMYLGMLGENKIGGNKYEVRIKNLSIEQHTASADVLLVNEDALSMHVYFQFVQSKAGVWSIISDNAYFIVGSL